MAGTNQAILGIALGADAAAPQYRLTVTGMDLRVATENAQREETGTSRDAGERVVTQRAVTGGFTTILRPATAPLLYYGLLGAKSVTGAASPYTHTLTPAADQPFVTLWRFLYGGFAEKFKSCKLISGQLSGGADQNNGDLVLQVGAIGMDAEDVTDTITFDPYDPQAAGAGVLDADDPIRWFGCTTNVDSVDAPNVDQMQNTINADQNAAKLKAVTYGKIEAGRRNIEHQYQLVFDSAEARTAYKRSAYGGSALTAPSDVVAEEVLDYTFVDSSGTPRMTMNIPRFSVVGDIELPVNPNGEMGRIGVVGGADRPASGAIQTVTFNNDVASYAAA